MNIRYHSHMRRNKITGIFSLLRTVLRLNSFTIYKQLLLNLQIIYPPYTMKRNKLRLLLASVLLVVVVINNGCKSDKDSVKPSKTCKLTQIESATSFTNGKNFSSNLMLDYNEKGQIVSSTSATTEKDDAGLISATSNISTHLVYNFDGFLTNTSGSSSLEGSSPYESEYSSTYEYQNDRLVSVATTELVSGSITYVYKRTYNYDGNGKLIKYAYAWTMGDVTSTNTYDFETRKVTMVGFTGEVTEGELNADGYLTKEVNLAGVERTYQYDDYGNLTHMEAWMDGKFYNASDYEYDDKVNPNYNYARPDLKGVPDLKVYRVISPIHNYTKEIHYNANAEGQKTIQSKKVYTLQYNTSGYPTLVTNVESNGQEEIISTTTTNYSYQDCE
jgi:YD repeat-containing protein